MTHNEQALHELPRTENVYIIDYLRRAKDPNSDLPRMAIGMSGDATRILLAMLAESELPPFRQPIVVVVNEDPERSEYKVPAGCPWEEIP